MGRPVASTLLLVLGASTGRAQESPDVYLGGRMPFAAFDRLPADRLIAPGGEITIAVAPGALELPRAALLASTWTRCGASWASRSMASARLDGAPLDAARPHHVSSPGRRR